LIENLLRLISAYSNPNLNPNHNSHPNPNPNPNSNSNPNPKAQKHFRENEMTSFFGQVFKYIFSATIGFQHDTCDFFWKKIIPF